MSYNAISIDNLRSILYDRGYKDHIVADIISQAESHPGLILVTDKNEKAADTAIFGLDKHPAPRGQSPILRYFEWRHLPTHLQRTSRHLGELALLLDSGLPDGPEKSAGLRKLLEAKDCFVRAAMSG